MAVKPKRKSQKKADANPVGRPTIWSDDVLQKLEYAFKLGCTNREACLHADISEASLYERLKQNEEYLEKVTAWKETPILLARTSVVEALKDDPDLAMKFLERKKKNEFSLKTEVDQSINGKMTVELVRFSDAPKDDDAPT